MHVFIFNTCSADGVATRYGLDGPGIESRWGEIFHTCPDRPRGPPGVPGLYPEDKAAGAWR